MPPPSLKSIEKPKIKPSPLNLQLKTNEPAPPSAALTALRSARPVDNLKHLQYPEGILSPNPALNPLASVIKFKYDKDFLMQFQTVFTEKPSVDWDLRMRETVGDTESARPGTARTPLGMGPRSTSRSGPSNMPPPMGSMGTFGSFGKPGSSMTGMDRFPKPSTTTNPLDRFNSLGRQGPGLVRTNSSTSLSGSSHQIPPSPRTGNRSSRGSKRGGAGGSSMERTDSRQSQGGPTIPLADVKPLEASASRWKPISIGKKPAAVAAEVAPGGEPDNRMAPEMVQRKVKAALNKMTPEKFDKIADQILEITSQSKFESDGRTLRQVIQLTFEKATDEAHWASMYAKFCKRMLETMDPNIKDENIRDKNQQVVTGGNLFRKYLLNRCQEEFERGWKVNLPPKPEGESEEAAVMLSDDYYIAAAAKRRGLGLVQFIGELFKLGMLTERIMNECVRKLLDFEGVPEDETVESLTKLLRTIGSQLDSSEKSRPVMDIYFGRIKAMIDNKELNSRMRFMLMDICDLRNAKWESKETNKGPMTIQEIKAEAVKAQQEKEAASRANRGNRPQAGRGDARSFSHGGGYGGGGMHPPGGFHDNKSGGIVSQDDLRKLNNRGSRQNTSAQNFGPSSMFANNTRSSSGSGSRRGLGLGASRGDDSGSGSRNATPPAPASTSSPNPFRYITPLPLN
ncbi:armadillo-type protein [Geopyxis carbonaria]|nr:armadillo-type protein [Geopyxis carbonaria]